MDVKAVASTFYLSQTPKGKRLTTAPPDITEGVFEDVLSSDDLLVDYFNEFLGLPVFPEDVKYNRIFQVFEVMNNSAERLKQQVKKLLREQQPPNPIFDVTRHAASAEPANKKISDLNVDNNYSVMCMNREQGLHWIKKERLPFFLESDCYFEYRLAKLMSQVKLSNAGAAISLDSRFKPWLITKQTPPVPTVEDDDVDDNERFLKMLYVNFGQTSSTHTQEWISLAKEGLQTPKTSSFYTKEWFSLAELGLQTPYTGSTVTNGHTSNISTAGQPSSLDLVQSPHTSIRASFKDNEKGPCASCSVGPDLVQLTCTSGCRSCGVAGTDSGTGVVKRFTGSLVDRRYPVKAAEALKPSDKTECDKEEHFVSISSAPSPSPLRVYVDLTCEKEIQETRTPVFTSLEEFAAFYIDRVIKAAIATLTGQTHMIDNDGIDVHTLLEVIIESSPPSQTPSLTSIPSEVIIDEDSMTSDSEMGDAPPGADWNISHSPCNIHSRKLFERFKAFLKGTLGENHWLLWLDIERIKVLKDHRRLASHLNRMKTLYLATNGERFLKAEILSKLNLLDASQWNLQYLSLIQTEVVKPLLLYWGPRFCAAHSASEEGVAAQLKLWKERQLRPNIDVVPFPQTVTLLPLRARSCLPMISTSSANQTPVKAQMHHFAKHARIMSANPPEAKTRLVKHSIAKTTLVRTYTGAVYRSTAWANQTISSSNMVQVTDLGDYWPNLEPSQHRVEGRTDLLLCKCTLDRAIPGGSRLEHMLQALHLESRAGYYFMHFCEESGNELWRNSVYFWFDLQAFHYLFCLDTLHPFKLKRQAQLIFSTYLGPVAFWDIGAEQCIKKEIYAKLHPPYEDLFDLAEEYILNLLIVPWIKMRDEDRSRFGRMELVKEPRQLDSVDFRKLQALQQESTSKKDESPAPATVILSPPDTIKEPNLWEHVPDEYRNYNLSFLLRHRLEIEHFRAFLEDHFASMDLMCWVDIEQFRRMVNKERDKREEKSKDIKTKYLNKKYFFGPNSPATRNQQEQVLQLGGGWGNILQDRLAQVVLLEVQKYARMRIEKKWLPLFLATEEYRERQKVQGQMKDVNEDVGFQTQRKKMGVYKHLDSRWITSSKEIIEFRKALLNPVTLIQFQRFICLKGDFLEKDLLFWLEVQRYKDLCHSHSDDATIQNKISTIIDCFINSSIPPALQIDITPEQAQKILEHRRDLGPYVFREAQMAIFSLLFSFWAEFCEFRSSVTDEKILPVLERKRDKKLDRLKRKMKGEDSRLFLTHEDAEDSPRLGRNLYDMYDISRRRGTLSDTYLDSGSTFSGGTYGPRPVTWSYSKYIEALEQERMLQKIQEELGRKRLSSTSSVASSIVSAKTEETKRSAKSAILSKQLPKR